MITLNYTESSVTASYTSNQIESFHNKAENNDCSSCVLIMYRQLYQHGLKDTLVNVEIAFRVYLFSYSLKLCRLTQLFKAEPIKGWNANNDESRAVEYALKMSIQNDNLLEMSFHILIRDFASEKARNANFI